VVVHPLEAVDGYLGSAIETAYGPALPFDVFNFVAGLVRSTVGAECVDPRLIE